MALSKFKLARKNLTYTESRPAREKTNKHPSIYVYTERFFLVVGTRWDLVYIEKNFKLMNSTTFVLFCKYYPIVHQLGSKDSSRDFQLNCVISFFTYIYYFMHGFKDWSDGERVKKILTFKVHLNKAWVSKTFHPHLLPTPTSTTKWELELVQFFRTVVVLR
jgi:hypothetical protein